MAEKKTKVAKEEELAAATQDNQVDEKDWAKNETAEFKGDYIKAIGRRKQSVAQVRLWLMVSEPLNILLAKVIV